MIVTMCLGPVLFQIAPMSLQKFKQARKYPFASHEVLGAAPVLEDMGPDSTTISIEAVLHPEHFGGLSNIALLRQARDAATPLPLTRGDFTPLGFFVIEEVDEAHDHINELGVGREIEVEIKLRSVSVPGVDGALSIISLFG